MDSLKVLMVDDESRMRKLVSDFLTRKGYQVIEAGDGEEAIDKFYEDKNISLVILDVMMPKLDGMTATRLIRAMDREDARVIPIIAMTANAFEEDARKCIAAGMNVHMAKPLDLDEVIEVIARLCS